VGTELVDTQIDQRCFSCRNSIEDSAANALGIVEEVSRYLPSIDNQMGSQFGHFFFNTPYRKTFTELPV
jgi:hypothetical protein